MNLNLNQAFQNLPIDLEKKICKAHDLYMEGKVVQARVMNVAVAGPLAALIAVQQAFKGLEQATSSFAKHAVTWLNKGKTPGYAKSWGADLDITIEKVKMYAKSAIYSLFIGAVNPQRNYELQCRLGVVQVQDATPDEQSDEATSNDSIHPAISETERQEEHDRRYGLVPYNGVSVRSEEPTLRGLRPNMHFAEEFLRRPSNFHVPMRPVPDLVLPRGNSTDDTILELDITGADRTDQVVRLLPTNEPVDDVINQGQDPVISESERQQEHDRSHVFVPYNARNGEIHVDVRLVEELLRRFSSHHVAGRQVPDLVLPSGNSVDNDIPELDITNADTAGHVVPRLFTSQRRFVADVHRLLGNPALLDQLRLRRNLGAFFSMMVQQNRPMIRSTSTSQAAEDSDSNNNRQVVLQQGTTANRYQIIDMTRQLFAGASETVGRGISMARENPMRATAMATAGIFGLLADLTAYREITIGDVTVIFHGFTC